MNPRERVVHTLRETWFWAGVLRDHASFIHDALTPAETVEIQRAQALLETFGQVHDQTQELATRLGVAGPAGTYALAGVPVQEGALLEQLQGPELRYWEQEASRVSDGALEAVGAIWQWNQEVLARQLDCRIQLKLPPVLVAHAIAETEEAHRSLSGAQEAAALPPAVEALHHHLLWLPDAASHAGALHGGLDPTEADLLASTQRFQQIFEGMEIKAHELYSMLRIAPRMVGALQRLNRDALSQIGVFRTFLTEMREMLEGCQVLGQLSPLLADHMLREELYYSEKLMQIAAKT